MKTLLLTLTLFISRLAYSQDTLSTTKIFTISSSPIFKVYVDSQQDNRTYLNVYEKLPKNSQYKHSFRRYEIQYLEAVKNGIVYYIGNNQYCFYNQEKGEGKICEDRQDGYKCKTWSN